LIGKCSYIEAVESPRCHWEDNVFHLEPGFQDVENLSLAEGTIAIFWQEKTCFLAELTLSQTQKMKL
jgi:gamma-glutamyltranspeptidase/glutathione hydrolase